MDGRLGAVQVLDVVDQAFRVVEADLALEVLFVDVFGIVVEGVGLVPGFRNRLEAGFLDGDAFIDKLDGQTLVQEGHLLQAARDGVEVELDRLEDLRVRPKTDGGAGAAGVAALD